MSSPMFRTINWLNSPPLLSTIALYVASTFRRVDAQSLVATVGPVAVPSVSQVRVRSHVTLGHRSCLLNARERRDDQPVRRDHYRRLVSGPSWDEWKHRRNLALRRIGFGEASSALEDPDRVSWADVSHSVEEDRYITVGITRRGRFALVVTSLSELGEIRIISARRPTRRERHAYETRRPGD